MSAFNLSSALEPGDQLTFYPGALVRVTDRRPKKHVFDGGEHLCGLQWATSIPFKDLYSILFTRKNCRVMIMVRFRATAKREKKQVFKSGD